MATASPPPAGARGCPPARAKTIARRPAAPAPVGAWRRCRGRRPRRGASARACRSWLRLQAGRQLERHPGIDARIVQAVDQQHRRVGGLVDDVVVGAHGEQAAETVGGGDGAEPLDVGHAVIGGLGAQQVGLAHHVDGDAEQVGALGDGTADEDAAGAAALARQALMRGAPRRRRDGAAVARASPPARRSSAARWRRRRRAVALERVIGLPRSLGRCPFG